MRVLKEERRLQLDWRMDMVAACGASWTDWELTASCSWGQEATCSLGRGRWFGTRIRATCVSVPNAPAALLG